MLEKRIRFGLCLCKELLAKGGICLKQNGFIANEFKQMFKKRSVMISAIIALLVPLVYAAIILSAKWGPYDNIDNLPVAVVNNDKGAVSDGKRINIGEELVKSLEENRSLGWDFVTAEEAEKGMKDLKYYMMIEVPEDFSEKALTVMDDNPEQPELNFVQNEGLHFMAAQVTKNAMELIKNQLSSQITKTYVETVFSQLEEVSEGFQEAADGAGKINEGSAQLKDGSEQILSALTEKASDIDRLADGAVQLHNGTKTMRDSLVSKQGDINKLAQGAGELHEGTGELYSNLRGKSGDIGKLADGANQLHEGTRQLYSSLNGKASDIGKLADGASELHEGTTTLKTLLATGKEGVDKLAKGSTDLKNGLNGLNEGAKQVLDGLGQASLGAGELNKGLEALQQGSANLENGLKQAKQQTNQKMGELKQGLQLLYDTANNNGDLPLSTIKDSLGEILSQIDDDPGSALDPLIAGAENLRINLSSESEFGAGLNKLSKTLPLLQEGQQQVVGGTEELIEGAMQLEAGTNQLNSSWDLLIAGAEELDGGAAQIAAGNAQVNAGWKELQNGAQQLQAGAKQVADGNQTVKTGWNQLTVGAGKLHDGSGQIADGNRTVASGWQELSAGAAQLNDGASQIADGNQAVKEGWNTLTDGVSQVDDGLGQLVKGSDELKTGLEGGAERTSALDPSEENVTMFAEPVVLSGEVINSYPFYRDANAPYILTLALYVGLLVMSVAVPFTRPATMPSSPLVWFGGKVAKISVLAIAQALIVSLYSLIVLRMEVQSAIGFILFTLFVSLTFMMIILFLVVLAGNIGRFAAVAFVVLQLSTTGSALPVHMLPEGLRNLSVFLPFTYSINGYRNIITLGNSSAIWQSVTVLLIFLLVFAVLALAAFFWKYRTLKVDNVELVEEAV